MPWIARILNGPLAGERVLINEDDTPEPPALLSLVGCRYVYSGRPGDTPVYRFDREMTDEELDRGDGPPKATVVPDAWA